jgi:predicted transcriptional regulator
LRKEKETKGGLNPRDNRPEVYKDTKTEGSDRQPGGIIVSFPLITVEETVDFLDSVRRFCKHDIMVIANILESENGLMFHALSLKSELDSNTLNHTLAEMEKAGFIKVTGKPRCKVYYLTKYGSIVYAAVNGAMSVVNNLLNSANSVEATPKSAIGSATN